MPQILPIKKLKETAEISDLCHRTEEPIFITKNGYGDMVLMSMETYENTLSKYSLYRSLELSEKQFNAGRSKDAELSLKEMREKYGV